ncbi:MAG: DUF2807 domain-containing protein [Prevotellaceae bacterium]|jgi:hypothetical protein|nr:DUF2807 domain-containing protein [Prevotellaceae bacterium]
MSAPKNFTHKKKGIRRQLLQKVEIQGSKNVVSKEVYLNDFERLNLATRGLVEIIPSDEHKVIIETDDNLMEYFEISSTANTLYVNVDEKHARPMYTQLTIKIYVKQVTSIYSTGKAYIHTVSALTVNGPVGIKMLGEGSGMLYIQAATLVLVREGSGRLALKGKCTTFDIVNAGDGKLACREMEANILLLNNKGNGKTEVYARHQFSVKNHANAVITCYGPAKHRDLMNYGEGQIVAGELPVKESEVNQ